MPTVLTVSAYRFVRIEDPAALRNAVHERAAALGLRGTVLLATEGINVFLAGAVEAVREFFDWLRTDTRFAGLQPTESSADAVPFGRLQVKVKREIIRLDQPAVQPDAGRAPGVDAATLARWLDAGCDDAGLPLALLDTRNGFEVDHGRFRGAIDWRLAKFGDFPAAAEQHRQQLADCTVVTYCTGGIRCEKAALYLAQVGVERVHQLDGGILNYLQQVGDRHFEGSCFVFDQRIAVDAATAAGPPVTSGASAGVTQPV